MSDGPNKVAALVVAAGRGRRFGDSLPKQYHALAGRPVLRHAVEALLHHPSIAAVQVVIGPDDRAFHDVALSGLRVLPPVPGGETRQQSVLRGLEALAAINDRPDSVLIHDGARPLLDRQVIDRLVASLRSRSAAIAAVPVTDTLKRGNGGAIAGTVDRSALWRAQTPQAFPFAAILAAHRAASQSSDLTDDAAVAERAGLAVALVMGDEDNIKITTADDLRRAERILAARRGSAAAPAAPELRVGKGFDVHGFEPGDAVYLCGIPLPHKAKLSGHSDADVALHALTDALLGAIAAGDIGKHFPPSDARWRGADSAQFLRHAADLVAARGGRIVNVDITIICERPKVGPHRDKMQERVAGILGIDVDRVSVKATTTERLGFTGREEGIAAEAVATVAL